MAHSDPSGAGMRRREFIAAIAGVAASQPFAASAERSHGSVPLLGMVSFGSASSPISVRSREAFLRGLRENGYVVDQNIAIEERFSADPDKLRTAVDQIVRLNVDVILAGGTQAALAAKRATDTIPIVGAAMADPVSDGLVASLARPGGNVTGNTFLGPELGPKRLQILKETVPAATRFAALQHPKVYSERTMRTMVSELEEKARGLSVEFRFFSVSRPDEFEDAFEAMSEWQAEALLTFPSPMFYVNYKRLVSLAANHRLPTMYVFREAVDAGGLMCYGADIPDLSRLSAKYVVKILQGAKPGDLPVEQPTKFESVINLKTAKALGLTMPPTLLGVADEVIE
jgi:putative ABC transport system substrate-binding protein